MLRSYAYKASHKVAILCSRAIGNLRLKALCSLSAISTLQHSVLAALNLLPRGLLRNTGGARALPETHFFISSVTGSCGKPPKAKNNTLMKQAPKKDLEPLSVVGSW